MSRADLLGAKIHCPSRENGVFQMLSMFLRVLRMRVLNRRLLMSEDDFGRLRVDLGPFDLDAVTLLMSSLNGAPSVAPVVPGDANTTMINRLSSDVD